MCIRDRYMQSEVNQKENLNRIITVPNLLSFFRLCLIQMCIRDRTNIKPDEVHICDWDNYL